MITQARHITSLFRKGLKTFRNKANTITAHLLFPATDLHPCWGQSHCPTHRCSKFHWLFRRCLDHLSVPSCLESQTCAVCHPDCPEWWLMEKFSNGVYNWCVWKMWMHINFKTNTPCSCSRSCRASTPLLPDGPAPSSETDSPSRSRDDTELERLDGPKGGNIF